MIGIAVIAVGLPKELERFISDVANSKPITPYRIQAITEKDMTFTNMAVFNKAKCLNVAIKRLLPDCEVIIQTDVDITIPQGLIDYTYANTKDCHLWNANITNQPEIKRNPGAFNALSSINWKRVGGYDERCQGWGGEDNILHTRIKEQGIKTIKVKGFPLIHVAHDARVWRTQSNNAQANYRYRLMKQRNYL